MRNRRRRSIGVGAEEESEEEEIVAAQEQIDKVTEQIATSEAGGTVETMEDIRQLAQATAAAGSLELEEDSGVEIA